MGTHRLYILTCIALLATSHSSLAGDWLRELQLRATDAGTATWGHWGRRPDLYHDWKSHSNRLVPVYTFGMTLAPYRDHQSVYRNPKKLAALYGTTPPGTYNPEANYLDQTDLYRLQRKAISAGKKYIFLVIFDGLDWHTTRAASTYLSDETLYHRGRGTGLSFQDYDQVVTDFGFMVTAPHNLGSTPDPDRQTVADAGGTQSGGYHPELGGHAPWDRPRRPAYLVGAMPGWPHPVTDSAAAATAMTTGIKTYNSGINVSPAGRQLTPLARLLQSHHGFSLGVVTSVPISHATPACAYANNVTRHDFQDLSRDLVGLRSIAHPGTPLPGLDVLIGAGWGVRLESDPKQGSNYVPGNRYLTRTDLHALRERYVVTQRTAGIAGAESLRTAANRAVRESKPLFGFYGTEHAHLPYQTADADFAPTSGLKPLESYSPADIHENPTLAEMTCSALQVLETNPHGFWLMVEAGDVDWASHGNNLDNCIGAVRSGVTAFDQITAWVERTQNWDRTLVIVTADHGHLFCLRDPAQLRNSDSSHLD